MLCTLKQNFRRSFAVNWNLIGSLKNQQKKGHALVAWNVESKYNFHQLHPHLHGFWFRTTSKIKGQRLPSFFCQTNLRIAATFDSKKGGNSLILKKNHILAIFPKSVQSFPKNKTLHCCFTIFSPFWTCFPPPSYNRPTTEIHSPKKTSLWHFIKSVQNFQRDKTLPCLIPYFLIIFCQIRTPIADTQTTFLTARRIGALILSKITSWHFSKTSQRNSK